MYPEENYTPYKPKSDNRQTKFRLIMLIGLPLLFLVIIVIVVLRPASNGSSAPQYNLRSTNLTASMDYPYLNGSDLYTYNGLAFYKTNMEASGSNATTTVLSKGLRLPTPSNIYWADSRGALLTFKESFYLTPVETALTGIGQTINDTTRSYSWYLDFASGKLQLVNRRPIVPGLAHYSKSQKGFYYIESAFPDENDNIASPLHFFDISANRDQIVSSNLGVTDVRRLTECPTTDSTAKNICLVARDSKDQKAERLYNVSHNGRRTQLLDSKGRLFPTNNPNIYIAVSRGEEAEKIQGSRNQEQADFTEEPAVLHNLETNVTRTLDFRVGGSNNITAYFGDDDNFYFIDSVVEDKSNEEQPDAFVYRAGTIADGSASELRTVLFQDNTAFTGSLTSSNGYGNNGTSLLSTTNGGLMLFAKSDSIVKLSGVDQQTVQATINTCKPTGFQDSQYFLDIRQFRVTFTADDSFANRIATFSDCMTKTNPSVITGYNFHFAGSDPINGRLSTD